MPTIVFRLAQAVAVALFCAFALPLASSAQAAAPRWSIALSVDASHAAHKIYRVRETMTARPGPFTFVYPKWIPGFHGPVGPLPGVVGLHVSSAGNALDWRRDLVDFYAIHTTVPAGAANIDLTFDLVTAPASIGEDQPTNTANLMILQWNSVLFYPQGAASDDVRATADITLPAGWQYGCALPQRAASGANVSFEPVTLTTLVDSPLLAGRYFRRLSLSSAPPAELDIAADSTAALEMPRKLQDGMRHLIEEAPAMYASRHWRTYHFLLALSDELSFNGIEHHESSDNRAGEQYLTDESQFRAGADLMPHEYSHSWNGKYRRPYDLYQRDYQQPERTDLLWVYEGLNQYLGEVLMTRSRFVTLREQRENLAMTAANMDSEGGRRWRPLRDIADEAPILYVTPDAWRALRRSANDFYSEGNLIWLEADTIIRQQSHGARSLDDFLHRWASGGNTTPSVKTYTFDDVIATLEATQPYDWRRFFHDRIDVVRPRAPLGGIENAGWRLTYDGTPSQLWKDYESSEKLTDVRYSVGIVIANADGNINDVLPGSPAALAGIAPNSKLLAVNGRKWSADVLHDAISTAAKTRRPLDLLVANGDFYTTASVAAYTGNRYPHLQRISGKPDLLERIYAPRTFAPPAEPKSPS